METRYGLGSSQDVNEISRLDVQHQLWKVLLDGRLLEAPCDGFKSLLDLGCGSGIWAAEVAEAFPAARVVGVDITPPVTDFGRSNLQFVRGNVEEPWKFLEELGQETWDVITMRVMAPAISNWPLVFRRCYDHLKPGGWLEVPDLQLVIFSDLIDWTDPASCPLFCWHWHFRKGLQHMGIDPFAARSRIRHLYDAGFLRLSEAFYKAYLHPGAADSARDREIARLAHLDLLSVIEPLTRSMEKPRQSGALRLTDQEVIEMKEAAKKDFLDNAALNKCYWIFSVHYGQKPLAK